jgi:carbon-monoxide dehydrogenase medium subunit
MKPASFRYYAPQNVDEAVALLGEHAGEDGHILAGGQSLVPMMALRLARPGALIDINQIASFAEIICESGWLAIGPCVRHAAFHKSVVDNPLGTLLSDVAKHIAHYPIRTRGTFCGSLAHADPSSEWCLVAAALGAEIHARNISDTRIINAVDFFSGAMVTTLKPDEMIVSVHLPLLPADSVFGFAEFSRRAGDFAMAAALTVYRLEDGRIADARLAVGGAEEDPRRIAQAEAILNGALPGTEIFREASKAAAAAIDPITDVQTNSHFRRKLVHTICERALARTVSRDG